MAEYKAAREGKLLVHDRHWCSCNYIGGGKCDIRFAHLGCSSFPRFAVAAIRVLRRFMFCVLCFVFFDARKLALSVSGVWFSRGGFGSSAAGASSAETML